MFDDDNALFSMESPASTVLEEKKITQEQVERIVEAFHRAGITDASEQKSIIRTFVLRPFESLQDLLSKDVRSILKHIESKSVEATPLVGSAWDNREGDTWIDKL